MGNLGWGKFVTKTGEGEGNGDHGAHNEPEREEEEAFEKKGPEKMYADHRTEPSREAPFPKSMLSCRRGWCFYKLPESKKEGPR